MSEKALLRRALRQRFGGEAARAEESRLLCAHILASGVYRDARVVGGYMPLRHEADVTAVLEDVLASGRILALLKKYGLPTETTETVDDLYAICCSDKKIAGSTIHLVVPEEIGGCTLQKMPVTALREWIAEGLIP